MLCSSEDYKNLVIEPGDFSFYYNGNKKRLHNVIDMMEKAGKLSRHFIIYTNDLVRLWTDFKSIHKIKKAAGGIVFNCQGDLLVIFRRGYWDLPKGHIDKGEKKKAAAVREVEEECGVKELIPGNKAGISYHVYREKGMKTLKKSTWYFMDTHHQSLKPQTTEGIESAQWIKPALFLEHFSMYASIRNLLEVIHKKALIKNKKDNAEAITQGLVDPGQSPGKNDHLFRF